MYSRRSRRIKPAGFFPANDGILNKSAVVSIHKNPYEHNKKLTLCSTPGSPEGRLLTGLVLA